MPRKHFSGITTIERLKQRCVVDDITGCWHWRGATTKDRCGKVMQRLHVFDGERGQFRTMSGPFAVLELSGKRKPGMQLGWRTCDSDDCMNDAHVQGGTRAEWGAWLRANRKWKGMPSKVAANRKSVRERAIIDEEKAARIRCSDRPNKELAAENGLKSAKYISQIKLNKAWRIPNPWQGLGAR